MYLQNLAEDRCVKANEACGEDLEPPDGNLCLLDWPFAGCNYSPKSYLVVADPLCCLSRMLWPVNGWKRSNAVSHLSPRSSSTAAGSFSSLLLFGETRYCRGQRLP